MSASTPVRTSTHPLDSIGFFRRWPSSPLRDVLYTGIWNSLIAVFLAVAVQMVHQDGGSFAIDLYRTMVVSNIVGYMIHGALLGGNLLLRGWPSRLAGAPRLLYHVTVVGLCVMLGIVFGTAVLKGVSPMVYLGRMAAMAPVIPFALVVAVIMFVILLAGERRVATETAAARQAEQVASAAQLLAEARLRALQAQIEPHFLYNTLANVVGLIDTQPATARHMLERFIDYLRASLAASRADSATFGTELDMARAYLDVLAVRMGPRLRYRFDVDPSLRTLPITPMLLQPVIENAVAHGLEPKVEGGNIAVRAAWQDGQLCIEVSDTGAGLSTAAPKPGGGVGLSNLRARLRSIYGPAAQVQLLENQPCGITVRLVLPLGENPKSTAPAP